jgi:hypothetical protein
MEEVGAFLQLPYLIWKQFIMHKLSKKSSAFIIRVQK